MMAAIGNPGFRAVVSRAAFALVGLPPPSLRTVIVPRSGARFGLPGPAPHLAGVTLGFFATACWMLQPLWSGGSPR